MVPLLSTTSATVFSPTQVPAKRDIAQPARPSSMISARLAGASVGISAAANAGSHWFGIDEEVAPGSSPATANTPPSAAVPAALACFNASAARSTPGFLAYHRPNTPATLAPPISPICWLPCTMVAASSSFRPGSKRTSCCFSSAAACHSARSTPPSGEPR